MGIMFRFENVLIEQRLRERTGQYAHFARALEKNKPIYLPSIGHDALKTLRDKPIIYIADTEYWVVHK
jgi:hypothetical protein